MRPVETLCSSFLQMLCHKLKSTDTNPRAIVTESGMMDYVTIETLLPIYDPLHKRWDCDEGRNLNKKGGWDIYMVILGIGTSDCSEWDRKYLAKFRGNSF